MKITNKRAMIMFDTLKESVKIADGGKLFTWDHHIRKQLVDQIINQQSDKLINLEGEGCGGQIMASEYVTLFL